MTYAEALADGRAALSIADIAGAPLDARLLLAAAADLDMAALIAGAGDPLPEVVEALYDTYLKRRLNGEPVQRIVGRTEFWGLPFALSAATLVPRPDTETLVEAVLEDVRSRGLRAIRICDLGTGSGAIAIALLTALPDATAVATDISDEALRMARANAAANGVADRIGFVNVDFARGPDGPFDVVVANPPYVRSDEIPALPREVRDFDPRAALDGGVDGLDAYRAILSRAGDLLAEEGTIAFEVGADQGAAVGGLCRKAGLHDIVVRRDLAGRRRVVSAVRRLQVANARTAKKALGKV